MSTTISRLQTALESQRPVTPPPRLLTKVVDVRTSTGYVALAAGQDAGVREGFVFLIHRDDEYLGKVRITTVWDNLSGGDILECKKLFKAGDGALLDRAPSGRLKSIKIDGGFGYLTNMRLDAAGRLIWTGSEPGRASASVMEKELTKEEVAAIWKLAEEAGVERLGPEYSGGSARITLTFDFESASKSIRVVPSSDVDNRPSALKALCDGLRATRNQ